MHIVWHSIEEVPCCFSGSSAKFQGHKGQQKFTDFDPNYAFPDCNPIEFTHGFGMMHKAWHGIEEVPYYFPRSSIKFQGHMGQKITKFYPNWGFPGCNSSLNSSMDLEWCTKLDIVKKTCLIGFRGPPSNFTVTRAEKWVIWIQVE